MKRTAIFMAGLVGLLSMGGLVRAQVPIPPPAADAPVRSSAELDQMLAPIALYPDPLIAVMLPAATLPSEVVTADRYLGGGGDPNQIDFQPWDPSVKAVARYPDVLKWMDDNLTWMVDVGRAFVSQPEDVMNSIQRLRAQALSLGNLQSTPQQRVITDNGIIEIVPASPEVVYVPVYQPQQVYYQPGYFLSFGIPLPIGVWLNHDFDWRDRRVVVWGHDHPRPREWWYRPPRERPRVFNRNTTIINNRQDVTVWHPRARPPLSGADRGDRGWGGRGGQSVMGPRAISPPATSRPLPPRAAPERRQPVAPVRPSGGALIGVNSAHETRNYSNRGQQSRQAVISRPAPAPRSAPAASPRAPSGSPERTRR